MKVYFKNFINLNDEEKRRVLELRNAPEHRGHMYNDHLITWEEHLNFIETLSQRTDRVYWAICVDGEVVGATNLIDISGSQAEKGVHIDKKLAGFGVFVIYHSLDYAFNVLGFQKLMGRIHVDNVKMYTMEKRHFFFQDDPAHSIECRGAKFNAIVLTKERWNQKKILIKQLLDKTYDVESVVWDAPSFLSELL